VSHAGTELQAAQLNVQLPATNESRGGAFGKRKTPLFCHFNSCKVDKPWPVVISSMFSDAKKMFSGRGDCSVPVVLSDDPALSQPR